MLLGIHKNLVLILLWVTLSASLSVGAFAQVGRNADVILISERVQATPGEEFYLALDMRIRKDWHVYWRNPGDAGLPPQINWLRKPAIEVGDFVWPIPKELLVKKDEIMDYGYEDKLVLPFKVRVPDDAIEEIVLRGEADYLICHKVCIPEVTPVHLKILIGDSSIDDFTATKEIEEALALVPAKLNGTATLDHSGTPWLLRVTSDELNMGGFESVRFFPYGHEITHATEQNFQVVGNELTLELVPSHVELSPPLTGVVVFESLGHERLGAEIEAIPGVLQPSRTGQTPKIGDTPEPAIALVELLIICLLAFIGGLILNLMPCVLPVLSIKTFGMLKVASTGQSHLLKVHGVLYTFGIVLSFLIVALGFLAIRSATGTANLGYQLQEPLIVSALAVVMFFIGLWLAGLFEFGSSVQNFGSELANRGGSLGAFSSGVLAAVVGAPCVGPFLGVALGAVVTQPSSVVIPVFLVMGLGFAMPFLVLSFIPGFIRILPKPGPWMETLKQFFSFPMFLTSAWLLAVLGALTDYSSVVRVILTAVGIWFLIWLLRKVQDRFLQVVILVSLFTPIVVPLFFPPRDYFPERFEFVDDVETGEWSPEKVESLIAEERGVFVDFTAIWCATCQLNKRTTLDSLRVRQAFGKTGTVFLTADFTKKNQVIAEEIKRYSRPGVPMYLYYSPGSSTPVVLPEILSRDLVIGLVEQNES